MTNIRGFNMSHHPSGANAEQEDWSQAKPGARTKRIRRKGVFREWGSRSRRILVRETEKP